ATSTARPRMRITARHRQDRIQDRIQDRTEDTTLMSESADPTKSPRSLHFPQAAAPQPVGFGLSPAMTKTSNGNFFEDFCTGQHIAHATPRTVTAGDVAIYNGLFGPRFAVQSSDAFAQKIGYPRSPADH